MDTSLTLLQSLQGSDNSESWAILDHLYRPLIRNWLTRNDVRVDDHDDVVQEVLLLVSKKVGQFQHSGQQGAFRNWLKQITINCLRNYGRKRANRIMAVGGSDFGEFLDKWADPASQVSEMWRANYQECVIGYVLSVAKNRFQENVYQAFYRTAILDQEAAKVAEDLEMSMAAIYAARSRVLKEVRTLKNGIIENERL